MKRKSYVKVLILLQVICLILILLPGCSQKVDSSGKDSSPNVVDVPVATDKPVQQTQQSTSNSSSISVSLPIIPPLITEQKTGAIVELVKAMADEYKDGEMTYDVYPMARSMENIMSGSADAHCPYVKNHNITDSDNLFYYTTETFGSVIFVLYTNKNVKDLTPENVLDKKFKVEIQPGHKEYLGDLPEAAPDAGLQKVDSGRIDGYIATMSMCDQMVKAMQLKNIKRQKFDTFETAIIFKKDDNGKQKRDIMNTLIKKIRENGEYDRIMGEINSKEVFIPDEQ
jgi:polar amino acid transport system substrate-binding protein